MSNQGDRAEEFAEFMNARYSSLARSAFMLTGDRGHAEDLVQASLMRTYLAWARLRDPANAEAYTRKVMLRLALRWRKRRWLGEEPSANPTGGVSTDHSSGMDMVVAVTRALRALPPAQRAVLVLRYYEQRSEMEIADLLGCSPGTVKSRAARALAAMRHARLLDE